MTLTVSTALSAHICRDSRTIMLDVLDLQKPRTSINRGRVVGEVVEQCLSVRSQNAKSLSSSAVNPLV